MCEHQLSNTDAERKVTPLIPTYSKQKAFLLLKRWRPKTSSREYTSSTVMCSTSHDSNSRIIHQGDTGRSLCSCTYAVLGGQGPSHQGMEKVWHKREQSLSKEEEKSKTWLRPGFQGFDSSCNPDIPLGGPPDSIKDRWFMLMTRQRLFVMVQAPWPLGAAKTLSLSLTLANCLPSPCPHFLPGQVEGEETEKGEPIHLGPPLLFKSCVCHLQVSLFISFDLKQVTASLWASVSPSESGNNILTMKLMKLKF